MNNLKKELNLKYKKYIQIKNYLEKRNHNVFGTLSIRKFGQKVYYYQNIFNEKTRKFYKKYIPREEIKFVEKLAQKSYEKELINLIDIRIRQMKSLLNEFDEFEIENVYLNLSEERKKLVKPIEPTREQLIKKWKESYKKVEFLPTGDKFITKNGENARSKTEMIIANKLYDNHIEYAYEKPVMIYNKIVYPDFIIFLPSENKEIYWEHFGMMDEPSYLSKALNKINLYYQSEIVRDNFIMTFETKDNQINFNSIDNIIKKIKNVI